MKLPHMKQSLDIIDKHVGYLLNHGGTKKLEQWLLTDDKNFNAITAERYIIGYLQQRNGNLDDNLLADGVDASLKYGNSSIGIEITTLNGDIASWILTERLTQFLDESGFLNDNGLDIAYSQHKISNATKGGTIYSYVSQVGKAIVSNDYQATCKLGLSVKYRSDPGSISWDINDSDNYPWLQDITDDLSLRLQDKSKAKQLQKFPRNIVFVGLNHSSPSHRPFPSIFKNLGYGKTHYRSEIQKIREYWVSQMPSLTNVIGICYFFYSIEREVPFYPLKVFWRSDNEKIMIKL